MKYRINERSNKEELVVSDKIFYVQNAGVKTLYFGVRKRRDFIILLILIFIKRGEDES